MDTPAPHPHGRAMPPRTMAGLQRPTTREAFIGEGFPGRMRGIIPPRAEGVAARPPTLHDPVEGDPMFMSHRLWDLQQTFDERLHQERGLPYPRDLEPGPERDQCAVHWMWGQTFAMLSELQELEEALTADNADEETVDQLHFIMSLAEKMSMGPADLGRFEDRFEVACQAMSDAGITDWKDAYRHVLPGFVGALSDVVGATFKWWKSQPERLDREPHWDALRRIDHFNMCMACLVFKDAEAMYQYYIDKNQHNHDRQEGLVSERRDYKVA